jgi:type I restriction enzyme S subunit
MIGDTKAGGKYIDCTKSRITRDGIRKSREVFPGELLLSNSMSFGRPYILRTYGCIHDGWLVLKPKRDDIDIDYAYHALGSVQTMAQFQKQAAGATVKNLNKEIVASVQIPLPPLEEQRRIAEILDKASALQARSEEGMRLVKSLGLARLEQLLVDHEQALAPHRLEDICHGAPITYGILQPGPEIDGGVPYVRPSEIKNSQIDVSRVRRTSAEIAERYRKSALQAGDILFTIVGTIGEVAIVPPELESANITQSSCRLRVNSSVANSLFVYYSLRTQHVKRQIDRDRLGVAVERLNLHHVRDIEILSLPRPVQDLFAAEVQKLGSLASLWMLSTAKVSAVSMALKCSLLENR